MLHLKQVYPDVSCRYLADSKNFPYGEKTSAQISACSAEAVARIEQKWHPQTVVVACNTISVTALNELRAGFPRLSFVGTVPAVKLAASVTKNHVIGLLATNATVRHPYVKKLEQDFAADCTVVSRGDAELVSFIEHNLFTATDAEKRAAVRPAVSYFASQGCDTIILGCTHFLHLAEILSAEAGSAVQVVDSRAGVARQAMRLLHASDESAVTHDDADESLFVTGFTRPEDRREYELLCSQFSIPWGGCI